MTDVAKIANAISRPRIDPRKFVDLGVVTAVDVTAAGVHVDVTTLDGVQETAAVAPPYGGPGYGLHLPIDLDRVAVLVVPDGVFNAGARVVGTAWDEGDPPPADVLAHKEDVVLVVKPGQSLRLIVSAGANIVLEARGGGKIKHGGDDANDPFMRVSDMQAFIDTYYNAHVHPETGTTTSPPVVLAAAPSGSPIATST